MILKKILPTSLFGRFLLIIITPVVLLQVISVYLFYERHWDRVTRRLASTVAGDIALIVDLIEQEYTPLDKIRTWAWANLELTINYQPDDQFNWLYKNVTSDEIVYYLSSEIENVVGKRHTITRNHKLEKIRITVEMKEGVLYIDTTEKRVFSSTTYIFVMWVIGMTILLYGIAVLFMRNQIRPIKKLSIAADALGKGQDIADLKPHGAQEVRQAMLAFRRMRDRLNRYVQQRADMLSGVSHDLRTPLTRMKLQLAMVEDLPDKTSIYDDLKEMEQLIEGYLAFARGEGDEKSEKTNITKLVKDVTHQARRNGINATFRQSESDAVSALIKPQSLSRTVTNLVGNAGRYANKTEVCIKKEGDEILIYIDDDGPGIPPEKRDDVFRPFFRMEESRNQKTGGVGLGLAIARSGVRAHGGDIELDDSPLGGLRAIIRMPV